MSRCLIQRYAAVLVLLCTGITQVLAGACCFTTSTTEISTHTYNITVFGVHSDIKDNNNIYRALISFPATYRFVGSATGGATCTNGTVPTSYDCTGNNPNKFEAQIVVQQPSNVSGTPPVELSIFKDRCEQNIQCPDVMTDSSESKPSSSGDETVYLGPFGNVTKPVAIGIGVAFGIIAIGVAYAIIRRVFPGKSNGTIVRTPNPATHYTNTIPMESRGNDKDGDPGAAYGAGSGPNGTSNSGGLRNNIRQSRLWNAMGGAAASLGNSSNGRQRKGRDDGYTNVQDFNEKEINMNRAATMSPVEAVVVKDIAEIMPLKTSTRNANPTAMMTSVVVDLGVEPSATRDNQTSTGSSQPVSRSASRAASRKSSVHRSGTARRANTFGHSAAHKSQTSLGQTANEHSDAGKSVSRQPSTHRLHSDKHAVVSRSSTVTGKSIPVDSPMRRSKSSSKVGAKPAGGSTHRRTASSHDNQSRRSSSSQRKTPKLAEDEPSLPNNFDLALLSKKLKQQEQAQRRYPANDQDSTPIGVLHKRSLSATPQLKVH